MRIREIAHFWLGPLIALIVLASSPAHALVPPLTDDEQALLETADASRDFREPAFFALLDNTKQWTDPPGDAPVRLTFDEATAEADEAAYRGELFRLEGRVDQIEWFSDPYDGVIAWFLRDASDAPRLIFIDTRPGFVDIAEGQRAVVYARFYKLIEKTAADGVTRRYAAFVGALPQRASMMPAESALTPAGVVVGLVLIAGVMFLLARRAASQSRRLDRRPPHHSTDTVEADAMIADDLPPDPDAALAELARRAKDAR